MVYGIGCDLCSIARMEKSLLGPHGAVFARRVFGPAEQAALGLPLAEEEGTARRTAHTVASAAADFAAKEAFLKAAGTGLREPFSLCEIEAVRLPGGAPFRPCAPGLPEPAAGAAQEQPRPGRQPGHGRGAPALPRRRPLRATGQAPGRTGRRARPAQLA